VTDVLDHRSGLLGVSGIGNDMRALLASPAPEAADAVALFVYCVGRGLARSRRRWLAGTNALVFTAGIGEHAAPVRARVCEDAAWLGVRLDPAANLTDEELMIARHTLACIRRGGPR
jgi:acetate kinase